MKVPYFVRLPGLGKVIDTFVTIPDGISIASLKLSLLPNGNPTGNYEILEEIGRANNVDIGQMHTMEFIALWYKKHIENGGAPLVNYDELKSYFWDALGYIKYPNEWNFHFLVVRDEENYLGIDLCVLMDVCEANDLDLASIHINNFVCQAYGEYIETGGIKDSETDKFITRLEQGNSSPNFIV